MAVLGIMTGGSTPRPAYWERYRRASLRSGFTNVIIFTPHDVDLSRKTVFGYTYQQGVWRRRRRPLPHIVHDVGYYQSSRTICKVKQLKASDQLPFVGYSLGNKWHIQQRLLHTSAVVFLPETDLLKSAGQALEWVQRYGSAVIKPINGKGGQGIVKIGAAGPNRYVLQHARRMPMRVTGKSLTEQIGKLICKRRYLVQRWLDIVDPDGRTSDIRILLQKNGLGEWVIAAEAMRRGLQGHITSNINSGGVAEPVQPSLCRMIDEPKAVETLERIRGLACVLPGELERVYGRRLCELGLDVAVDRTGNVWLIEVNIKPGKSILKLYGGDAVERGFEAPVRYAGYLLAAGTGSRRTP